MLNLLWGGKESSTRNSNRKPAKKENHRRSQLEKLEDRVYYYETS